MGRTIETPINEVAQLLTATGLASGISIILSCVICGLAILFGKSWFEKKLQSQITDNETKLKKIQSELDKGNHIHRIQFEKEFQIYEEIWEKLINLEHSTFHYIYNTNEDKVLEKSSAFHQALDEFRICYDKNQPFYPENIYTILNKTYRLTLDGANNKYKDISSYREKDYTDIHNNVLTSLSLIRERISSIQISE